MPEVEIGPFEVTTGPPDHRETLRVLRIAGVSATTVPLPEGVKTRGELVTHVAALLKAQERRLVNLLFAFREGSVGFEETQTGELVRLTYTYPDLEDSEGRVS